MKTDPQQDLEDLASQVRQSLMAKDEVSVEDALSLGLEHLKEIRADAKQTANDLHQIRNLLAALLILGMIWFFAVAILELSR